MVRHVFIVVLPHMPPHVYRSLKGLRLLEFMYEKRAPRPRDCGGGPDGRGSVAHLSDNRRQRMAGWPSVGYRISENIIKTQVGCGMEPVSCARMGKEGAGAADTL